MALAIGVPLPNAGATTLAQLIDGVFSNRSPELASGSAVFTASEGNVLVVSWPAVADGDNAIYIRIAARPSWPEVITL